MRLESELADGQERPQLRKGSVSTLTNIPLEKDPIEEIYARAVSVHSQRTKQSSMFPGDNYRRLASFLCRPYGSSRIQATSKDVPPSSPFPFAILHRLGPNSNGYVGSSDSTANSTSNSDSEPRLGRGSSSTAQKSSFDFSDAGLDTFRRTTPSSGDMLFLQGVASPEWINHVGSKYGVDPEFFRRHADSPASSPLGHFDLPSLQSSNIDILTLPITSIGRWGTTMPPGLSLGTERRASKACSKSPFPPLRSTPVGTSMVRDEIHRLKSYILPVYQYQPKMFLNTPASENPTTPSLSGDNKLFQSSSLLAQQYGQGLDRETAREDGLYALSELFMFSAFSESQFLNLLGQLIEEEDEMLRSSTLHPEKRTTVNLEFYKRTIDSHMRTLKAAYSCIEAGGGPTWPRASGKRQQAIANATMEKLKGDYAELIHRADAQSKRCVDASYLLMNKIMIEDTQRGLLQAEAMARLTLLAYFFVPLSFTSSFFGMNFREMQDSEGPRLSVWLGFVVSVPVLLLAITMYFREQLRSLYARFRDMRS
ncbi:hypothetical protein QQX98_007999 [Neonectria punicea]|uniref:Uncharacterized protein n=1 Tax=Neonectria punicea TaxID=979145 RepID=A0ABR1GWA1_9HYPO